MPIYELALFMKWEPERVRLLKKRLPRDYYWLITVAKAQKQARDALAKQWKVPTNVVPKFGLEQ